MEKKEIVKDHLIRFLKNKVICLAVAGSPVLYVYTSIHRS